MLLRRVTKHVKDQNWFAVALDFVIVVVGILIAFQITNWTEARSKKKLKYYYLERIQSDLTDTTDYLSGRLEQAENTLVIIDTFVAALNKSDLESEELVRITTDYFARGTGLPDFKVTRTTFDELSSTGNLETLGRGSYITELTRLNTNYADQALDLLVNTEWVTAFESDLIAEFDWFRFDELTTHLFPPESSEDIALDIRANTDKLRRHAAIHYWVVDNVRRDYETMIADTASVQEMTASEMGDE